MVNIYHIQDTQVQFTELATEQQFGYSAFATTKIGGKIPIVVSNITNRNVSLFDQRS